MQKADSVSKGKWENAHQKMWLTASRKDGSTMKCDHCGKGRPTLFNKDGKFCGFSCYRAWLKRRQSKLLDKAAKADTGCEQGELIFEAIATRRDRQKMAQKLKADKVV